MITTMAAPNHKIHGATGGAGRPPVRMEDDLKRWLQRPKVSSSSRKLPKKSILRHAPPPPPPRRRKSRDDINPMAGHASYNQAPSMTHDMDRGALHESLSRQHAAAHHSKRRGSRQGSVGSTTSSHTSRVSRKKKDQDQTLPAGGPLLPGGAGLHSQSTDSMASMPLFDVVAFDELNEVEKGNIVSSYAKINSNDGSIFSLTSRKHKKKNRKKGSKSNPDGYGSDASKTSDLSKRSRISQTSESSKRSWMSQQTEASYSSVFTNMNFKLKGFSIKDRKPRKKERDQHSSRTRNNLSSSDGDLLSAALGTSRTTSTSGRKTPKYRDLSKHSSGSETVTTAGSSISPLQHPRQSVSFTQSDPNMHVLEEEKPIKPPSMSSFPLAGHTVTVATKGAPQESSTSKEDTTRVFDLPWVDNTFGGNMHGVYTGPINDDLQPHGNGSLVLEGNPFLKFYGQWVTGALVSPLKNEEEQREHEKLGNASNKQASTNQEYQPKSSTEYRKTTSKEHKRKSSKEYRKKSYGDYNKKISRDHSVSTLGSSSQSFGDHSRGSGLDPPPSGDLSSSSGAHHKKKHSHRRKPKYALGEVAHTPRDMIIHRDSKEGIHSASLLKQYDQAFLKRSNGLWTCAVLADKALQPKTSLSSHWYTKHEIERETMEVEEAMLFVINEDGATKIVKRRHWGRFVRCMQQFDREGDSSVNLSVNL